VEKVLRKDHTELLRWVISLCHQDYRAVSPFCLPWSHYLRKSANSMRAGVFIPSFCRTPGTKPGTDLVKKRKTVLVRSAVALVQIFRLLNTFTCF
jgi:hypothetical protein